MRRSDHLGRLYAKSTIENGCCVWNGKRRPDGYGIIRLDGVDQRTHRAAYNLLVGPIPEGLVIDHLCRNRACWNPEHLEPVSNEEHLRRMRGHNVSPKRIARAIPPPKTAGAGWRNSVKTHCARGHEFNDENTAVGMTERGTPRRFCRACARDWSVSRPSRSLQVAEDGT